MSIHKRVLMLRLTLAATLLIGAMLIAIAYSRNSTPFYSANAASPPMSNVKVMDYIQMNDFVFYRLLLKDDTQCVVIIKATPAVTCDWKSK